MWVIWKPFTQLVFAVAEQTFWTIRSMTPEMVGGEVVVVVAAAGLSATSAQIQ
jgi:hypothetical protein